LAAVVKFFATSNIPFMRIGSASFRSMIVEAVKLGQAHPKETPDVLVPEMYRQELSHSMRRLGDSLFDSTIRTLQSPPITPVVVTIDAGTISGRSYIAALVAAPLRGIPPFLFALDMGPTGRTDYAIFAATVVSQLLAFKIPVGCFVTDGLVRQCHALTAGDTTGMAVTFAHLLNDVDFPLPFHMPCICHLIQLAFLHVLPNSIFDDLVTQLRRTAVELHKAPYRLRCPTFSETRWLDVVRVARWIQQRQKQCQPCLAELYPALGKEIPFLIAALEPCRAMIIASEGNAVSGCTVFPLLLQMFAAYDHLESMPLFVRTPKWQQAVHKLAESLYSLTLGSDNGLKYLIAYGFTKPGAKALKENTVPTILEPDDSDKPFDVKILHTYMEPFSAIFNPSQVKRRRRPRKRPHLETDEKGSTLAANACDDHEESEEMHTDRDNVEPDNAMAEPSSESSEAFVGKEPSSTSDDEADLELSIQTRSLYAAGIHLRRGGGETASSDAAAASSSSSPGSNTDKIRLTWMQRIQQTKWDIATYNLAKDLFTAITSPENMMLPATSYSSSSSSSSAESPPVPVDPREPRDSYISPATLCLSMIPVASKRKPSRSGSNSLEIPDASSLRPRKRRRLLSGLGADAVPVTEHRILDPSVLTADAAEADSAAGSQADLDFSFPFQREVEPESEPEPDSPTVPAARARAQFNPSDRQEALLGLHRYWTGTLDEIFPELQRDIRQFWFKLAQDAGPLRYLARFAMAFLASLASEAPCERLFSRMRRVIGDHRFSLAPETLFALLFLLV
jgi:hypothetical protein